MIPGPLSSVLGPRSLVPLRSRLYAIVDDEIARTHGWESLALARELLEGGARLIQLRAKHLGSAAMLCLAETVIEMARRFDATVILNDRADLAALAGAAGVHVGQTDLPASAARAIVGASALVGLSTHDLAQVEAAAPAPVDYLAFGPVFETVSKSTGYAPRGLATLTMACQRSARPMVAIGGLTLERAPAAMAAGAHAVAVISDLLVEADPRGRVARYLAVLDREHR